MRSWVQFGLRSGPAMIIGFTALIATAAGTPPAPGAAGSSSAAPQIGDTAMTQICALLQEKLSRSAIHRKLDSQFVFKLKRDRNQIADAVLKDVQPSLKFEPDGRLLVDIAAQVNDGLLAQIRASGGTIRSSVPRFHSVRALVSIERLETLAARDDVKWIGRAVKARCRATGVDSQGDTTLGAITARRNFGVTGAGVNVGVLSDSVDFLTNAQAAGDLGAVTVLPGQSGLNMGGAGEGTAMLEIVHDLAPGAALFFATADISEASFAQNILDLQSAGCNIIMDDVGYFDESPFQDGPIAQAVNTVAANGAMYFSAAGNDGNLDDGTSSSWEGDFVDGGPVAGTISRLEGANARLHNFGPATFDAVVSGAPGTFEAALFWSDPLGASDNDYDLFVLSPSGSSIVAFSNNPQNGTQDPFEICAARAGDLIVAVKFSGAGRFLHVQVEADGQARLSVATTGNTIGHSCAASAFGVAAVNAEASFPNLFTANNVVETFTSDGPRHIFYNADGSAITPGDLSSTGGAFRQKPDLASADGVSVTVPGPFQPLFFGTSAATPHAASLAALLLSFKPGLTPLEVRQILNATALNIMAPRDAGAGIAMAIPALQSIAPAFPPVLSAALFQGTVTLSWTTVIGHSYQPQYTDSPGSPAWNNLGQAIPGNSGTATASDAVGTNPQRFYRIVVQ
jgi:hypothetical protein